MYSDLYFLINLKPYLLCASLQLCKPSTLHQLPGKAESFFCELYSHDHRNKSLYHPGLWLIFLCHIEKGYQEHHRSLSSPFLILSATSFCDKPSFLASPNIMIEFSATLFLIEFFEVGLGLFFLKLIFGPFQRA